jgi:transcriptional regulator with XRE-family HTH domain
MFVLNRKTPSAPAAKRKRCFRSAALGVNGGLAHHWELRSIDPSSSAIRRLGDTLYNLRIQAGLTRAQLAIRTDGRWSRSHIGRVENGDVTPSPDFVEAMDGLLGGGHTLVRCLPPLLLETAKHRSRRQRLRREPEDRCHSTSQKPENLIDPRFTLHLIQPRTIQPPRRAPRPPSLRRPPQARRGPT